MSGGFITFEGIDGAGKSTHIGALAEWLRGRGHDVVTTREPGGSEVAERLRELVLHAPMDALTETLVVFAARRDHLQRRIEPALGRGALVLCDRFTDASFAYQGGGRGIDPGIIATLERIAAGIKPDFTLLLDVGIDIGLARARARGGAPDRIESEREEFFERVRAAYLARAAAEPARFCVVDAGQAAEQVVQEVRQRLGAWLDAGA